MWERLWKHAGREGKDVEIKRDIRECAGEKKEEGVGEGSLEGVSHVSRPHPLMRKTDDC